MSQYFSKINRTRHSNRRTNLFATLTLVTVLSGILLFFTNEKQNEQVLKSYCGDFGFYGKSLVLMKDSTFRFSYYGCSQTNGHVRGTWNVDGITLKFAAEQHDDNLDFQYQISGAELVPINKSSDEKFILCEYYKDPWERIDTNETLLANNTYE
jgi:hypothetical protein